MGITFDPSAGLSHPFSKHPALQTSNMVHFTNFLAIFAFSATASTFAAPQSVIFCMPLHPPDHFLASYYHCDKIDYARDIDGFGSACGHELVDSWPCRDVFCDQLCVSRLAF